MTAGPQHRPERAFWPAVIAATLIAILSGVALFVWATRSRNFASLSDTAREELSTVVVPARASAAVEREWVGDFATPNWLLAPVGPTPCPGAEEALAPADRAAAIEAIALRDAGDPDVLATVADANPGNLLVALVFGTELVRAGRFAEASGVIGRTLDRTRDDNRIIENARDPRLHLDLSDGGVSTVVHLHHARGVAQLMQGGSGAPWDSLKNVIGSVKALSRRRLSGSTRDEPTWGKLGIAAPGCAAAGPGSLSSYDLYNNLIVAYMRGGYAAPDNATRTKEFYRDRRTHPSAVHTILLEQVKRAQANGWKDESQLWALSNVEQVLDWRRPDDARLNINAIRVVDFWLEEARCPKNICTDALRAEWAAQKDQLLEQAWLRHNVTADQQRSFAETATRLLAESTLDRGRIADGAGVLRGWLPPAQAATLAELIAADGARQKLPRAIVGLAADGEAPESALKRRGAEWRAAAEIDFASAAATWARGRSPAEQDAVLIAARQLLGAREAPAEVRALELQRGLPTRIGLRLKASKVWWAVWSLVLAALVWVILLMAIMAVRDWLLARLSFYNVELEYQRGSEPPRRRSGR